MTKTAYLAGLAALLAVVISGCSMGGMRPQAKATAPVASAATPADDSDPLAMVSAYADPGTSNTSRPALDPLIAQYSSSYNIPEGLVRRVIVRESRYNPAARNGPYYGLMQISHATARGMGYRGEAGGLLDAETNLRYAVKYLAGAYMVAGGNEDQAVRFYSRGYYYDAKRAGLLEETGLR